MMKSMLLLAVLFLASVYATSAVDVCDDFCSLVDCMPMTEEECEGIFKPKGGACGCCDACFKELGPGEPCEYYAFAEPPEGLCTNGYWCDNLKGVCSILLPG